jgi:hypothetical protein
MCRPPCAPRSGRVHASPACMDRCVLPAGRVHAASCLLPACASSLLTPLASPPSPPIVCVRFLTPHPLRSQGENTPLHFAAEQVNLDVCKVIQDTHSTHSVHAACAPRHYTLSMCTLSMCILHSRAAISRCLGQPSAGDTRGAPASHARRTGRLVCASCGDTGTRSPAHLPATGRLVCAAGLLRGHFPATACEDRIG